MFFDLVDAVRSANPRAQFFCVGDDWQAINGFAGSDLRFFDKFAGYFRDTSRYHIRTNYRSPRLVVEVGNAVMQERGPAAEPARADAGLVRLCRLDDFKPSAAEQARHSGDEITPAVLRLVKHFLDRGQNVVMLSRRKGVPWYVSYNEPTVGVSDALTRFLELVRSYLPEEDRRRVTSSTAHGYKGREESTVVVLDAVKRSYPLIHPAWVFLRVFGDSIDRIVDEERRLFYVAVTRAKQSLALVTESRLESPYLGGIRQQVRLASLPWEHLTPVSSQDGSHLQIRVLNAYDVKDQLKDRGYRFDGKGKYWHKGVAAEGFSFDALLEQPWARDRVRIEVYTGTGQLLHRR